MACTDSSPETYEEEEFAYKIFLISFLDPLFEDLQTALYIHSQK